MRYILFIVILLPQILMARPISYPGGWTVMQSNSWEKNRLHIHYSPTNKSSIGIAIEDLLESDRFNISMQWNKLLYRKNTKRSQTNIYLKTQAGIATLGDKNEPNANIGLSADWETRRWFTSYDAHLRWADELNDGSLYHKARIGIAPYVAEYGNLHTWLMLQIEHSPEADNNDNQLIITPIVRLLKGQYLGEFGVNSNGDILFNWIIRF